MSLLVVSLDVILAGVLVEAVLLRRWLHLRGRREAAAPALLFLASGGLLLLSVRAALVGAGAALIGALLLGAGILHVMCLVRAYRLLPAPERD